MIHIRNLPRLLPAICYLLFAIFYSLFAASCWQPAGVGIGGHYNDGKMEVIRGGRRGDIDKAIEKLEHVVRNDPFYRDSLTLLGRAYYKKGRYKDVLEVLKRALAVNQNDEIAWITLGLTQLRLGDDERGLESLKGGITLLSKASQDGYRGIKEWDVRGQVRAAIRRAALVAVKGLEEKQNIIRAGETLLDTIDGEEWQGKIDQDVRKRSP